MTDFIKLVNKSSYYIFNLFKFNFKKSKRVGWDKLKLIDSNISTSFNFKFYIDFFSFIFLWINFKLTGWTSSYLLAIKNDIFEIIFKFSFYISWFISNKYLSIILAARKKVWGFYVKF